MFSYFSFENPFMLLVFPLACLLLFYAIRKKSFLGKSNLTALVLKITFLLLVTIAAAGLRTQTVTDKLYRIYLLDVSNSAYLQEDKALQAVYSGIMALKEQDNAGLVIFAEEPSVEIPPSEIREITLPAGLKSKIGRNATSLGAALKRMPPLFPDEFYKEIVLVTDGNFTDEDWETEFAGMLNKGYKFQIVPAVPENTADLRIEDVAIPQFAPPGQPIEARVRLSGSIYADAVIEVHRGDFSSKDQPLKSASANLIAGKPVWVNIKLPALDKAAEKFTFIAKPSGWNEVCEENNSITRVVRRSDAPACLVLSDETNSNGLAHILQNAMPELQVETAQDLKGLAYYDALIVDNINYESLSRENRTMVESFLADGNGILWLGGENSFAPGGYSGTDMEELMPVFAYPREELALMILLDTSGSMGESVQGKRKFSITVESLETMLPMLSEKDRAGILTFSSGQNNLNEIMPLGRLDNPAKLFANLKGITTGGGTELVMPVKTAIEVLKNVTYPRKHIVLITDGESNEKLSQFAQLSDQLKEAGISVSIFATREDIDEKYCNNLLMLCSNNTNGTFNKIDKTFDLGRMLKSDLTVTKELITAAGKAPAAANGTLWDGLKQFPSINRYNRTTSKEQAIVHVAMPDGDPITASWRYKNGKSAVFTASFRKGWADNWLAWENRNEFVAGILKELLPVKNSGIIDTQTIFSGNNGKFRIRILDKTKLTNIMKDTPALYAVLTDGFGRENAVPLAQKEWDTFTGEFSFKNGGIYTMRITARPAASSTDAAILLDHQVISVPYSAEWAHIGLNEENLARLSSFENVRTAGSMGEVIRPKAESVEYRNLASYLLIAGVILLVISAWYETKN